MDSDTIMLIAAFAFLIGFAAVAACGMALGAYMMLRSDWPVLLWYHDGKMTKKFIRPGSRVRLPNRKKGFNRYVFGNFTTYTYKFVGTCETPDPVTRDDMGNLSLDVTEDCQVTRADGRFYRID